MRQRIFSIWSVLLILVVSTAVLVPGCGGGTTQGTIEVKATLDGAAWTGGLEFTLLYGPAQPGAASPISGTTVPFGPTSVSPGSWTCGYYSGGPSGASFVNITPSANQTVAAAGRITFTLNFVTPATVPLDHFKFYEVVGGPYVDLVLPKVGDQFYTGIQEVEVGSLRYFGNPVAKTHDGEVTEIGHPDYHLTLYEIFPPMVQYWMVEVDNQFGRQELTVYGPAMLAVPTLKEGHDAPVGLDHFLLYKVAEGQDLQVTVDLEDQWHIESDVELYHPVYFANPAGKISPYGDWNPSDPLVIQNPDEHLVFYQIAGEPYQGNVVIQNQFHQQETLSVSQAELLAVPSEKIGFEPFEPEPVALDHFACYWIAEEASPVEHGVLSLKDQFVDMEAELGWPLYFCNPVEKVYEGVVTPILDPDHHLTIYEIYHQQEPQYWQVEVNNQFGTWGSTSWPMIVRGPVALAVPTQKAVPGGHGAPVGLDHFLLYEVVSILPDWNIIIDGLEDQFFYQQDVGLTLPYYFANPVRKTDASGMVTEIQNPQAHLLFHTIMAQPYAFPPVQVVNQFGEQFYPNVWGPYLVAVPSVKMGWETSEKPP